MKQFVQSKEAGLSIIEPSLDYINAVLEHFEFESIVDFGCGYGNHVALFAERGKKAYGVDIDFVQEAIIDSKDKGYTLIKDSWDNIQGRIFDAGWSHHSLEHARDPIDWLNSWGRLIKPGGKLFVVVPAYREKVLAGHINTGWNPIQLAYTMAIAGWDCSEGFFEEKDGNVYGVAVRPENMQISDTHVFGFGRAAELMPDTISVCERGVSFLGEPRKLFT